ncbi:MAG: hypothetical protein AB1384_14250 [Actinomycetota bacterium]
MDERFELEENDYGLWLCLKSEWTDDLADYIHEHNIKGLSLHFWKGDNLSFLSQIYDLEMLDIHDFRIKDISPIHFLHNLKMMTLTTISKTKIDFTQFPQLEDCGLMWKANSDSLFDCITLKRLYLDGYKSKDTDKFSKLVNLERLSILNSSIHNLWGLKRLSRLKKLVLGNLRVLESLKGIEELFNLEELEVITCRSIGTIEEVRDLTKLRFLYIDNCGEIDNLEPLRNLNYLERFGFIESTNILDGDLSVLFELPRLEQVAFQQRRHYSHKRDDFRANGIKA